VCYKCVTSVLQVYYKCVTSVLQVCYKCVTRVKCYLASSRGGLVVTHAGTMLVTCRGRRQRLARLLLPAATAHTIEAWPLPLRRGTSITRHRGLGLWAVSRAVAVALLRSSASPVSSGPCPPDGRPVLPVGNNSVSMLEKNGFDVRE
jgi:hypothetical protein